MLPLRAPQDGRVPIQCGEYCGLGHSKMIGSIEVVSGH
jgi:cytochrome c oxidase subunit 2